MDKITTTLLTGAAMGALVAPAMAAQHIPLGVHNHDHGLALIKNGKVFFKTPTLKPGDIDYTFTYSTTFNFTGNRTTMYKQVKDLFPGITWYSSTCTSTSAGQICYLQDSPQQKWKASHDIFAKIKAYSSFYHTTYHFTTTYGYHYTTYITFTYRGPAYTLKNNSVTADNFVWHDNVKFTTSHTTSVRHKLKKFKYDYTANMKHHVSIH